MEYDDDVTEGKSAADAFAALGDPTRRGVLDALRDGERSVGEIVAELGLAQPRVSKHLRALSDAGLVRCRAVGRRRLYRLESARLRALADWLTRYEVAVNARLDRAGSYLYDLQGKAGTP